jgi:hypothetical protein
MSLFSRSPFKPDNPVPGSAAPADIAARIRQLLPDVYSGTLCFWGVWFGRPHDNCHSIVGAEADGDCLVLHFNDEEALMVWHPNGCRIGAREFVIETASRVQWQWYWYGRPHVPENLMRYDLTRQGTMVAFQSTFPHGQPAAPSLAEPAVQIH